MRRVPAAAAASLLFAALLDAVIWFKARANGHQPPEWTVEGMLELAAVLFVAILVLWPRDFPLPFEKVPRPRANPPDEGPPG
jgi:hypothetical protein